MKQAIYLNNDTATSLGDIPRISEHELTPSLLSDTACIIVEGNNANAALDMITAIRLHDSPMVYLLPLVLVVDGTTVNQTLQISDDEVIIRDDIDEQLTQVISKVSPVCDWIKQLERFKNDSADSLSLRLIRLMASRDIPLIPQATTAIPEGYIFPLIQPLFQSQDTSALYTLNRLASQHILLAKKINRAHFCNHCGSAFLNFKETCVQCGSDDLVEDELVHHFKCAHTAEKSAFTNAQGELQCPKCDETLKHIGVDYDKPSTITQCLTCSHKSQSTHVVAECFNCHRTSEPEYLDKRDINQFKLSSIGMNAAIYGLDTFFTNILENELQLIPHQEFIRFLDIEVARSVRYKLSNSSLILLRFDNIHELYDKLGSRAQDVFTEICHLFKKVLRETDLITAYNETFFSLMMIETSVENSTLALERLKAAVQDIMSSSLETALELQFKAYHVSSELGYQSLVNDFLEATNNTE